MNNSKIKQIEFIAMMASLMALSSLSMDALLPAVNVIGESIGATSQTQGQQLVTMMFLGLGVGQLFTGALSDAMGRKPVIYMGFALFSLASIASIFSPNYEVMIISRFIQGFGVSAPKAVSIAIVRDSYSGDRMAKIMSFISVVFIIIPTVAPSYGMFFLKWFGWQSIFTSQIVFAVIVCLWIAARQYETLPLDERTPFKFTALVRSIRYFFGQKESVLYTVALGMLTGAFLVFLSTAQNILGVQYGLEEMFPKLFALVAMAMGVSTLMNGFVVEKIGAGKLISISSLFFTLISLLYIFIFYGEGNPPIKVLLFFLVLQFSTMGFLFGNLSSLAMEPLGKIAGMGAAINGSLSTVIAVPIASFIGYYVVDTTYPLFVGFAASGTIAIILVWGKRYWVGGS
ncbi:multidrug effflux MFS transporter [Halosquirtibacter xylanolyticus]|uniref:multidrug effflux MFS transporter n=1 Tax=Halosquirtibacter xylanolyticus TaxID=3374599 RepID=UPI00374A2F6F|nr:multidrug effflux MFS transporter [Prolixibacteraceae bacterium]